MSDLTGQTLGQYEIQHLIGRGGMAAVYLARQKSINRMVAVKVLPPHLMAEETFLKRFQREVQAVALMQHPRIIPVHDYGDEHGTPFIVMAYIEGGSLAETIREQGALPIEEVVRLTEQIAEGLDFAHKQGVIHRDFKPSNVLLDRDRNAYLSDFGIAKVNQDTAQLTGSGMVGTPTYMAPEMFKQEMATPAVDIYALGVTVYQMLTGATPYEGTTPVQLMYAHLNQPVPSIEAARPGLPPAIQAVLDRAMAKNPEDRYPTGKALAAALRRAVEVETGDESTQVVPAGRSATNLASPTKGLATPQIATAHGGSWWSRQWRSVVAFIVALVAARFVVAPAPWIGMALAVLGVLLLLGVNLSQKAWRLAGLWLVFLIFGAIALGASQSDPGPTVILRLGVLGLAVAGVVFEYRAARKRRQAGQIAEGGQAGSKRGKG